MDITQIAASETFTLHLEHPTFGLLYSDKDKKKPITMTILGPDSKVARKQKHDSLNKQLATKNKDMTADQIFKEGNELLAERIIDVQGLEKDGRTVTADNVIDILSDISLGWLRDQIDRATVDRSLFFSNA
jgi:hypothetical protein